MIKNTYLFSFLLLVFSSTMAQIPKKLTSNEIFEKIQKLNFLGSVLYIAAHPDDENTRLISYMANKVKARTGYLSLTRGDGGQNLIGSEIREQLGVIRTQELLAAREIDGGEQFFTRANDFGYSKHPDETLEIWNKNEVLSDVVWVMRTFKPDVIINRFNHRTPGTTHGHHTSSAMLSVEAFEMVNDKNKFSNQLKFTDTWKPTRLFFNTSSWFYTNKEAFKKASKKFTAFDVGVYYPLKGLSNNEIASMASSQHLCQGFGRLTTRGSQKEYVEFLKGEIPKDNSDIFSGINTTWNRLKNGGEIGAILYKIEANFDFENPAKHLPKLIEAYLKIQQLENTHWRTIKEKELLTIIEACAGLYLEASATSSYSVPNENIDVHFEVLNRSQFSIELVSITSSIEKQVIEKNMFLSKNKKLVFKEKFALNNTSYTNPYWLNTPSSLGMYSVSNQLLIGKPETPRVLKVNFNLVIEGHLISIPKDVIHRYSERNIGEIYEPFEIVPKVTSTIKDKVILFPSKDEKNVSVTVYAGTNNINGTVSLSAPKGWEVTPVFHSFLIAKKGDVKEVVFTVKPTKKASEGVLTSIVTSNGKIFDKELTTIHYAHIPKQTVLSNSQVKVVRLDIKKANKKIGYIQGAGDLVPESLRQIGYEVTILKPSFINEKLLEKFDAIVIGIRAYNTIKLLQFKQDILLNFVSKGGTMVVQYNTNRNVNIAPPYPLNLSRDRVTDEFSKVTLLAKDHSILNYPNKITQKDFKGWVQERGLYFPNEWSSAYTPILSMNDKGEPSKKGSLLVAKYGKGYYIYTGLSFFRELPAGVSGAYKLFANILSIK